MPKVDDVLVKVEPLPLDRLLTELLGHVIRARVENLPAILRALELVRARAEARMGRAS